MTGWDVSRANLQVDFTVSVAGMLQQAGLLEESMRRLNDAFNQSFKSIERLLDLAVLGDSGPSVELQVWENEGGAL